MDTNLSVFTGRYDYSEFTGGCKQQNVDKKNEIPDSKRFFQKSIGDFSVKAVGENNNKSNASDSGYDTSSSSASAPKKKRYCIPRSEDELCAVGRGVSVMGSIVPFEGRGNGLFVDRKFYQNSFVTWYDGIPHHFSNNKEREEHLKDVHGSSHTMAINHDMVILGERDPEKAKLEKIGGGSFINDAIGQPMMANVKMVRSDIPGRTFVLFKAIRDIEINEEVIYKYPNSYWQHREKPRPVEYKIVERSDTAIKMRRTKKMD